MKRTLSPLLALAVITAMLSLFAGTASAQTAEPSGQITVVNGTAATVDAVATSPDGEPIDLGSGLAPGDVGTPTILPSGTYTVEMRDGEAVVASYTLPLEATTVWNVVSGYLSPSESIDPNADNAIAYTVHDEATPAVTVANSSQAEVTVMPVGTVVPQGNLVLMPDNSAIELTTPGGSSVPVDPSGAPSTSYSMVVAVGPDDGLLAATVTINDLAALRVELAGTTPPTTLPPAVVEVPDVVGAPEGDAEAAITAVGLVAGRSEASSDDVAVGVVISQDPAPATEVPDGSTVNIVVSSGPDAPALVPVPDVVGQDASEARTLLEGEGFVVETVDEPSETVEAGTVIGSNPSAGTEVAEGTTVVLTVSTGPGDVIVPDLSGMTTTEATAAAEDAGLTITFVEDPDEPDPEGIVVTQEPQEGASVEAGTEVVAQLSPAFDDAWTILVVDADRELTVTGINFAFNTSTVSAVVDTTISQTAGVGQSGSWTTTIDISSLDASEHFLHVTGTAEDGSDYEQTFKIPAAGQSTDQPDSGETDEGGFPVWGWIIIGLLVIGAVVLAIRALGGRGDANEDATGSIET